MFHTGPGGERSVCVCVCLREMSYIPVKWLSKFLEYLKALTQELRSSRVYIRCVLSIRNATVSDDLIHM